LLKPHRAVLMLTRAVKQAVFLYAEKARRYEMILEKSPSMQGYRPGLLPREMSRETFCRFRDYVTSHLGIKMPDVKKTMLQGRLQKRLRALGMASYDEYYDYVFSARGMDTELSHMVDAVTTNKTDFFREPRHFDYLEQVVLPKMLQAATTKGSGGFRFWSAGCSTGAEPYTLAMVLSEFALRHPEFRFSILATDISQRVLDEAKEGIYSESMAIPIPQALRRKYLLRSKDPMEPAIRIVPDLRSRVAFGRLNFMAEDFRLGYSMDIIFCRNVMIYFDRAVQEQVVNRFCRYLNPGGYLFVGHSETLNGLDVPLTQVSPTIYQLQLQESP
jgi:chemotaxis protein methyltransferase CheR